MDGEEFAPQRDFESIKFDAKPFAHGSCREAYRGRIRSSQNRKILDKLSRDGWVPVLMEGGRVVYPCVVKKFKSEHVRSASQWNVDLKLLAESQCFAKKFNQTMQPKREINFAKAFLAKTVETAKARSWARVEIVCVEPFLEGRFVKVLSNSGVFKDSEEAKIASAFSHWTWAETGGKMLICDLQGVMQDDGSWLLTDPAVLTPKVGTFGPTDLGLPGMHAFWFSHKCSEMCEHLPKPKPDGFPSSPPTLLHCRLGTTYTWQMADVSLCVHKQVGGTCYAHAAATVLRAAEGRIIGRCPENFESLVDRIIAKYGSDGACSTEVLANECPRKSLRHKRVQLHQAEEAMEKGHAILASFWLTEEMWNAFRDFFNKTPAGVLDELPAQNKGVTEGHSVVVAGQRKDLWFLKNSWGTKWAAEGYFRVKKELFTRIQSTYQHVYFLEQDLTSHDQQAYQHFRRNLIQAKL